MPPFSRSKWFYVFAIPTSALAGIAYANNLHIPIYNKALLAFTEMKPKGTPPRWPPHNE